MLTVKWYETETEIIEGDGETMPGESETTDEGEETFESDDEFSAAENATSFIKGKYCLYPSSSCFHSGIWYTNEADTDFRTGNLRETSCHVSGATSEEERAIHELIRGSK